VFIITSAISRTQQNTQGKLRLKRYVFRRLQKTGRDCADMTWCGKLFQTREAATRKARSPYVDSCVYHCHIVAYVFFVACLLTYCTVKWV